MMDTYNLVKHMKIIIRKVHNVSIRSIHNTAQCNMPPAILKGEIRSKGIISKQYMSSALRKPT